MMNEGYRTCSGCNRKIMVSPEACIYLIKTRKGKLFVLCLVRHPIMTSVIYAERKLQILTIRLGIVQKNVRKEILVVT